MKLSTGKVAFPIEFDNGDKAVIYFNPNDRGIQERIQNFEKSIQNRVEKINLERYKNELKDENYVGTGLSDPSKLFEMSMEELDKIKHNLSVVSDIATEYNNAVKDELDNIFGSIISNDVFRYCEPFDTVIIEDESGNEKRVFYIEHFVYWLADALKKHGEKNRSAMDKHLAKYNK